MAIKIDNGVACIRVGVVQKLILLSAVFEGLVYDCAGHAMAVGFFLFILSYYQRRQGRIFYPNQLCEYSSHLSITIRFLLPSSPKMNISLRIAPTFNLLTSFTLAFMKPSVSNVGGL